MDPFPHHRHPDDERPARQRGPVWRAAGLALLASLSCLAPTRAEERLTFIGVALDLETRQADKRLQEHLERKAGVSFAPEELEYERVVDRMANWNAQDGAFVARVTPYVYVVAEMLGAQFEALGTYVSAATGGRTYSSYIVVRRQDFPKPPTLEDVIRFLADSKERARFVYHSPFSTSSYFLPSLYLRSHRVFNMAEPTEALIAIRAERIQENSSSRLVELVASGQAAMAAVWDGTKSKFAADHPSGLHARFGKDVHFLQLPTALPDDLLVCSSGLEREVKDRLRSALPAEIGVGDFKAWSPIQEAHDARQALASLRWLARDRTPATTVEIRLKPGAKLTIRAAALIESARQAVRLAGTELTVFDPDFHEHIDFAWTLEPVHDGAVVLRSVLPGADVEEQTFRLSFVDSEDLTKRLVAIVHSRLNRIRYVWPLSSAAPIVIRDLAYSLPAGSPVKVQKITWLDPERNKFRGGQVFTAQIRRSDFFRYELDPEDFAQAGEAIAGLDPLGNSSYRVYLLRQAEERGLFRALTIAFVALLIGAAVFAVLGLIRAQPSPPATGRSGPAWPSPPLATPPTIPPTQVV